MTSKNDITGDLIKSKQTSDAYRENYDKIFRKTIDKSEIIGFTGKEDILLDKLEESQEQKQ